MKELKELPDIEQLKSLSNRQRVLYALKAAKLVAHLTTLPEAEEAVVTVEKWLEGKVTAEECKAAARVAYNPYTSYAAASAANSAANAADAAYYAACSPNPATYAARAAAAHASYHAARADPSVKQQLVDYYQYLLTMNERVWKMLEE